MYLIDLKEICEPLRANFSFESESSGLVENVVCLTVLGLIARLLRFARWLQADQVIQIRYRVRCQARQRVGLGQKTHKQCMSSTLCVDWTLWLAGVNWCAAAK